MGILKPSREIIRTVTERTHSGITPEIRDTMAIPSFLHPNPLVRWLVWRRYEVIGRMCGFHAGESVLEFGCGPGFFLPELSARGCRIMALDLFPQYAMDLCSISGISATFPNSLSEIADGTVNTIVAAQVLEHLDSPEDFFVGFKRILAPGGRLVVSLPTENRLYKLGKKAVGFGGKGGYHVSEIGSLMKLSEKHGFAVARKTTIPFRILPLYRVFELR